MKVLMKTELICNISQGFISVYSNNADKYLPGTLFLITALSNFTLKIYHFLRSLDIRTIQELLRHKNVETTMIYTHVINQGGKGVRNPADF
jgi:hypothetical protein